MLYQFNKFVKSELSGFTAKLKFCHQQLQQNNALLPLLHFPFCITEIEKRYMKNRIFDESIISVC